MSEGAQLVVRYTVYVFVRIGEALCVCVCVCVCVCLIVCRDD